MQLESLKQLYSGNEAAKAICDHMAARTRNQNETTLDRIIGHLSAADKEFKRSDLIAAFRRLQEVGCGQYVEGRHGWKSRFVWSVKSKHVASAALGNDEGSLNDEDEITEVVEDEIIEHTYILRPDFLVSIDLPVDLSRHEAQRLSQFIDSLSFEE